ncbi:MAG: hypothetical protein Solumvirus2_30 [Solumvirus sp.]|uniref:Transmembrane protein n=1 Tax=Solumvirus sp. TaxID=2487773 RepID=A0A3G5AJP7_9VIRU|nr:MAG: hypothetical protein Solumvirus2_30 [Solumvirus sp.]
MSIHSTDLITVDQYISERLEKEIKLLLIFINHGIWINLYCEFRWFLIFTFLFCVIGIMFGLIVDQDVNDPFTQQSCSEGMNPFTTTLKLSPMQKGICVLIHEIIKILIFLLVLILPESIMVYVIVIDIFIYLFLNRKSRVE